MKHEDPSKKGNISADLYIKPPPERDLDEDDLMELDVDDLRDKA